MPDIAQRKIPAFPDDVPIADISVVDFNLLSQGDQASAQTVLDACQGFGFFFLKNHHVDSSFMFDLANAVFQLPLEEKMKYEMGATGYYFGYKKSGGQYVDAKGTPDKSEFWNVSRDDVLHVGDNAPLEHPQPINDHRAELEDFMRSCHRVVTVILQAFEERFGLASGTLTELHRLDRTGGDQARVTHAPPLDSDVISLGEHTDFGSVTVLFNELGGLQVLNPNSNDWLYVKPKEGCAIINLGDAIVKLAGDRIYSGVHRVVGPPGEQSTYPRHSVVYFARPNGDVKLRSLFGDSDPSEEAMTADEWIAYRQKLRSTANYKGPETLKQSRGTEHHRERDTAQVSA